MSADRLNIKRTGFLPMAPESHQNLFNMGSLTCSHITTNED